MSELDDLLHDQESEGRLDSTGEFTLDGLKALRKIAACSLPRPAAWATLIAQALTELPANQVAVQSHGDVLWFEFRSSQNHLQGQLQSPSAAPQSQPKVQPNSQPDSMGPGSRNLHPESSTNLHLKPQANMWRAEDFHRLFFEPNLTEQSKAGNVPPGFVTLRRALAAATIPNQTKFHFVAPNDLEEVCFDGTSLRNQAITLPANQRAELFPSQGQPDGPAYLLGVESNVFATDLYQELRRHACLVPYQFTIHQANCNNLLELGFTVGQKEVVYDFMVATQGRNKIRAHRTDITSAFEPTFGPQPLAKVLCCYCVPRPNQRPKLKHLSGSASSIGWVHNRPPASLLELDSYPKSTSWAYFVRDHIVVDRVQLLLPSDPVTKGIFGFSCIIAADHLKVDATGLRLVRDQEWLKTLQAELQELSQKIGATRVDDQADILDYRSKNSSLSLGLGALMGLFFLVGAAANPVVMAIGGVGVWTACVNLVKSKSMYHEFLQKLNQRFQAFPAQVPAFATRLRQVQDPSQAEELLR